MVGFVCFGGESADIIRSGGERSLALKLPVYLFALLLAFSLACGNGGKSDEASSEPDRPDDALAIRAIDFQEVDELQDMIGQLGSGAVESGAIIYADLTGDLREEAVVPVTSQGTLGNIGYVIFTLDSGKPQPILTRTVDRSSASGLQMSVEDGVLMETRGVYGPEDPFCCPSQLRQTTFQWDGSQLQVQNEETVQQDPGPKR
jgi:hypothetical protein